VCVRASSGKSVPLLTSPFFDTIRRMSHALKDADFDKFSKQGAWWMRAIAELRRFAR
jgi:hypothetical protein